MRPQVAEAALPGRGGKSSRLTVGSGRVASAPALSACPPWPPPEGVGSLSRTSSPSILAEAPAHRVAAASSNQVSRPLWMVERIKPRPSPRPTDVPDNENIRSDVCRTVPARGKHRAGAGLARSSAPSLPAGEPLGCRPAVITGTYLARGRRDHERRQAGLVPSCAVVVDHAEEGPHMTRQHAPSDRVTELSVSDDLTVLSDVDEDGACCAGGLGQPRGEPVHPLPYGKTVTDDDGKRL